MKKKIVINRENIILLYWIISLGIFAFVSSNDGFGYELLILYYPFTKWFMHLLFTIVFIGFSVVYLKRFSRDRIAIVLLIKLLWDAAITLCINHRGFEQWGLFIFVQTGFLSFSIFRNYKTNIRMIIKVFLYFTTILCFQVIYTSIIIQSKFTPFNSTLYKTMFRIPYAHSNLIANVIGAALISLIILKPLFEKKRLIFWLGIILFFVGIILTKSRGGLLLTIIFVAIHYARECYNSVNRNRKYNILIGSLILLIFILILFYLKRDSVLSFISGFKGLSSFNTITSRRDEFWLYSLQEIRKHPILGRGIYLDQSQFVGSTGVHNIILETIMASGIIGLILHIVAITQFYYFVKKNVLPKKNEKLILYAIIVMLTYFYINSFFEACYYNYINDFLFWSMAGMVVVEIKKEKS